MMVDKGELGCDDESYRALIGSGVAARPVLAGGLAAAGRSHDEERPLLPLCKAWTLPLRDAPGAKAKRACLHQSASWFRLIDCSAKTKRNPRASHAHHVDSSKTQKSQTWQKNARMTATQASR